MITNTLYLPPRLFTVKERLAIERLGLRKYLGFSI